jgi:steroid 5-alpha reductase family enzyme
MAVPASPPGLKRAFAACAGVYLLALGAAVSAGLALGTLHPVFVVLAADLAATLVVYAASCIFHNASLYDAYWSVAPPIIALYWIWGSSLSLWRLLVMVLVFAWGVRLTLNWASGWRGLGHEDWRYAELRQQYKGRFWLINLVGIQLMPTLVVFAGCLALYPALTSNKPLSLPGTVALLVTAAAIIVETVADAELRAFGKIARSGEIMDRGVWAFSRHPNYLGEMGFWWGLFLCALAVSGACWWTVIGPLVITILFVFISIPLMEKRNKERRTGWNEYRRRVPLLLPRITRNNAHEGWSE